MRKTVVEIRGERFFLNGRPTYEDRSFGDTKVEGLLLNSRMVQGIFDDNNPDTATRWAYPDTHRWDADRNTSEFLEAMPLWRDHGVLAFTINLQGGSPEGYSKAQPWENSAFDSHGNLRPAWMGRLERILDRSDELGMVVILGIFYFGQASRLRDESAVLRALDNALQWLSERRYTNLLIEINNECNVRYTHPILQPERVHECIERAKAWPTGHGRFLVGTSYGGGVIPKPNVVRTSDFLLLHGNGVGDPARISEMVRLSREVEGYSPMPILFNEDDHFDFEQPGNNFLAALSEGASWGFFDPGSSNYQDGYQCPPVHWGINTDRKRDFFQLAQRISGR